MEDRPPRRRARRARRRVPGARLLLQIGRGPDYAWSATSASSDIIDQFAETLCGGDDLHYLFKGTCRAMETFDAGTLKGSSGNAGHGARRSTRPCTARSSATRRRRDEGRDRVAALDARPRAARRDALPRRSRPAASTRRSSSSRRWHGFELTFNWFYADDEAHREVLERTAAAARARRRSRPADERHRRVRVARLPRAARASAGRSTRRAARSSTGTTSPPPASARPTTTGRTARFTASLLLDKGVAARKTHTLASVVAAMNEAATQDLRVDARGRCSPTCSRTATAPSARDSADARAVARRVRTASRLDANGDGKIDAPGAAIMDAAWPRLADAVLAPVLGPLTDRLADAARRSTTPRTPAAARTAPAGTATSRRTSARCSAMPVQRAVRDARSAAAATSPRAATRSGRRSTRRRTRSPRRRAPIRPQWRADATAGADQLHRLPPGHDALDEPADLPAGRCRSARYR